MTTKDGRVFKLSDVRSQVTETTAELAVKQLSTDTSPQLREIELNQNSDSEAPLRGVTVFGGVDASVTAVLGAEGAIGQRVSYAGPEGYGLPTSAGWFASGNWAAGWDLSSTAFVGVVRGQQSLSGDSSFVSGSLGVFSVASIHDSKGNWLGLTVGVGPSLTLVGAKMGQSTTKEILVFDRRRRQ